MRPATLLKKILWRRCFPVNFVKFLRTHLFIEHLWWLLLAFRYLPKYVMYAKILAHVRRFYGNSRTLHWTVMQKLNQPWPCSFKNGLRNWMNFHCSTQKSEKLCIDGLFLSRAYNFSGRKIQRDYVSWNWRVMQNSRENWLVA